MSRAVIEPLALALSLLLSPFTSLALAAADHTLEREFAEQIKAIIVNNPHGVTEVKAWSGKTLQVTASRTGWGDAPALEAEVLFEQPSPDLLVVTSRPLKKESRISLSVRVPATVHVSVRGDKAPVRVTGATAGLSVETNSGAISLHLPKGSNADLSLRAFEGVITSDLPLTIFGPMDAHSLDGRIGIGGPPVILRSLRGAVNLLADDSAPGRSPAAASLLPAGNEMNAENRAAPVVRLNRRHSEPPASDAPVTRGASREEEDAIRLEARLVNLNVKVTDRMGKSVPNLKREDFTVLEENIKQDVSHFEPITSPISLVLLLDLSGSVRDKMKMITRAAKRFIESLRKDDQIAVATFTTRFTVVSGFTTDRKLLKARIDDTKNRGGDTAFYDATWASFDLFKEVREPRKAVVIMTDGIDSSLGRNERGSKRGFDELMMRVIEEDATVYPIYLDTEYETVVKDGNYSHEIYAQGRKQLDELAGQTGGSIFKAGRIEDLDGVYQRVASELHTLYSLAYPSKDTRKDGSWRRITIQVNRPGIAVRSKRGYYAK